MTHDEALDIVCTAASDWAGEYGGVNRLGDVDEALEVLRPGVFGQQEMFPKTTAERLAEIKAERDAMIRYVLGGRPPLFDRGAA